MNARNYKYSITVCTPTFNRGLYLNRVFDSLCIQDFNLFEWIIIDDGSTDDTQFIVKDIICRAKFPVVYAKQKNSGKHMAVNRALDLACGELFLILDSDDRCSIGALSFFYNEWQQICNIKDEVAGITALTMSENGSIVGSSFAHERHIDYLPYYYERHNIFGDKWDIHQTAVFKQYKFPETKNEKFCAEGLVWNRIARRYKMLFLNRPLKIVEYLPDGLSLNNRKIRIGSPINAMMYYEELIESNLSMFSRLKAAVNYFRFAFHGKRLAFAFSAHPFWGMLVSVLSIAFWVVDTQRPG